jgi:hypothetical protein
VAVTIGLREVLKSSLKDIVLNLQHENILELLYSNVNILHSWPTYLKNGQDSKFCMCFLLSKIMWGGEFKYDTFDIGTFVNATMDPQHNKKKLCEYSPI